jgi:predicted XRE-type DNA-binding protein
MQPHVMIQALQKQAKLTQTQIGEAIGRTQAHVCHLAKPPKKNSRPSHDVAEALARLCKKYAVVVQ